MSTEASAKVEDSRKKRPRRRDARRKTQDARKKRKDKLKIRPAQKWDGFFFGRGEWGKGGVGEWEKGRKGERRLGNG